MSSTTRQILLAALTCSTLTMAKTTPAQTLYVSDNGSNVYQVTPSGKASIFATGFSEATGLACNSSGDVFVADRGNGVIDEITPGGNVSTFANLGFASEPVGLAFNSNGDLFVSDYGIANGGGIFKITPGGQVSSFYSDPTGSIFSSAPGVVHQVSPLTVAAIYL